SNLSLCPDGARRLDSDPVDSRSRQPRPLQRRSRPDDDPLFGGLERKHVQRRPRGRGEAKALALADREPMGARLRPGDSALVVDGGAGWGAFWQVVREGCWIVVVGDETDLLAVRLVGNRQPAGTRVLAHRLLRPITDGEASNGELILGK